MAVLCLLTNTPWPWPTPAGAASARGGFPTLGTERERSGGGVAQRRSAQAQRGRLGCLLRAPGTESPSVLGTCVTKQTKDMRYSEAEQRWFLSFGRTHDDAVCPGK